MSVIWGNPNHEASELAIVAGVDPEHPDPRAPRSFYESLTDWVCRFTDAHLDSHRMLELARELTA